MQERERVISEQGMIYGFVTWLWNPYLAITPPRIQREGKYDEKQKNEGVVKEQSMEKRSQNLPKIDEGCSKKKRIERQEEVMLGPPVKLQSKQIINQVKIEDSGNIKKEIIQEKDRKSKDEQNFNDEEKVLWSKNDDKILRELVNVVGKKWKYISQELPNYSPKQIRERYLNHIRPHISHEKWTREEDNTLLDLIEQYGYKWKFLEGKIRNRSQNQIKNRFYGHLTKKFKKKMEAKEKEKERERRMREQIALKTEQNVVKGKRQ